MKIRSMIFLYVGISFGLFHCACRNSKESEIARLRSAVLDGDVAGVSDLITADPELKEADLWGDNRFSFTALSLAAANGQYGVCSNLLAAGARVNPQDKGGYTPLHWAAFWSAGHNDTKLVLLLLKHGADPKIKTRDGDVPFSVATNNASCPEALKSLLLATNRLNGGTGVSPNN
jgi:ankyrin repeat protein